MKRGILVGFSAHRWTLLDSYLGIIKYMVTFGYENAFRNTVVTGGFPWQRPILWRFFVVSLLFAKHAAEHTIELPLTFTWRHCNVLKATDNKWRHVGNTYADDDVIEWKHFPCHWPFVRGIHRWPVNSPHRGQWRGALMLSLIYAWINCWVKPPLHRAATFVPPLCDHKNG